MKTAIPLKLLSFPSSIFTWIHDITFVIKIIAGCFRFGEVWLSSRFTVLTFIAFRIINALKLKWIRLDTFFPLFTHAALNVVINYSVLKMIVGKCEGKGRWEERKFDVEERKVLSSRLFLSHNVSILKFNTLLNLAWVKKGTEPWLMMFDADLQITFFKLLRAK